MRSRTHGAVRPGRDRALEVRGPGVIKPGFMSKIPLPVARAAGLVVTLLLVGCAGDGLGAMSETAAAARGP